MMKTSSQQHQEYSVLNVYMLLCVLMYLQY